MAEPKAHEYAREGNVIELRSEIQRNRNVVHEKDGVRVY